MTGPLAERDEFYDGTQPDCSKCRNQSVHKISENLVQYNCEVECCEFERRMPTLAEAIRNAECLELDYGDMDEDEITELDDALDVIFGFCKKYLKDNTAEWKPWTDGHTGIKTGAATCSRCGTYDKTPFKYCRNCGRRMTGGLAEASV